MKLLNLLCITFLCFLTFCDSSTKLGDFVCSQNLDKTKMDNLFTNIEKTQNGMGCLSIFKNGQEIYQKAFGYGDIANKIKAEYNTKYRIGSVSKSFTAVVVMQLIEDGKLTLNTNLSSYFPDLPNADKITIEELLRHRSGLFDFTKSRDYVSWMTKPKTESELLAIIKENDTIFKPNEKTQYSNTNYELLAFIAEKIENKSFSEIVTNQVIQPLDLQNTIYGGKINHENNEALSYYKLKSWSLAPETDLSLAVGSGAIASNAYDINYFYYKLFSGKIVSLKSLNEMRTIIDNFGIGLMQTSFYGKKALGHNGSIDGFQARSVFFPDDSVSVTYLTNGINMSVDEILFGSLSILYNKNYNISKIQADIDSISTNLNQYMGTYTSPSFPLKISIITDGDSLIAKAKGQSSFILKPYGLHKFKYDHASLTIEFFPNKNKMILRQYGGVFEFEK